MKYVWLSFRCMKYKLCILLFVLFVSFYSLLLFYGEIVRNHHFVQSSLYFSPGEGLAVPFTEEQWEGICRVFGQYRDGIEGDAYITLELTVEENVAEEMEKFVMGETSVKPWYFCSKYSFQEEWNTFTKEEYKAREKIVCSHRKEKKVQIAGKWYQVRQWDAGHSEIPITTVAAEKLPVKQIMMDCGCMSGNDYQGFRRKMQKILPEYDCTINVSDRLITLERQKTYLFAAAVLISVFNIALIYQFVMQEQKRRIMIYRICGCRSGQLYLLSLVEILFLFLASFLPAVLFYYAGYAGMYRLHALSLKQPPGAFYILLAGGICGVLSLLVLFFSFWQIYRRSVKELYVEGVD
ncbi:MAG: hypothetical protein K2J67_02525 [Lachnospiraceae bacterium]|nr:hypothetical protein [Lachnospiraceae bacterium]